jgi:hypothetical protein
MAQTPVPEGLGSIPDHGDRSASHDAVKGAAPQFTEAGGQPYHQEQPSSAAALCVSLLPVPAAGSDRAAMIGAAHPFARLVLMGFVAPAATIYIAKAAKCPPALTAVAVGLELALAYLANRAANRTGMSTPADLRGLPA